MDFKYYKTTIVVGSMNTGRNSIQLQTDNSRLFCDGFAIVGAGDFTGYVVGLRSSDNQVIKEVPASYFVRDSSKFNHRDIDMFFPIKAAANGKVLYLDVTKQANAGTVTKFDVVLRLTNTEGKVQYVLQYETLPHPDAMGSEVFTISDQADRIIGINANHASNPDIEIDDFNSTLLQPVCGEMLQTAIEAPVVSGAFPLDIPNASAKRITVKAYSRVSTNPGGNIDFVFLMLPKAP